MAYKQVRLGEYFKFEKGIGYKGEFLAEDSDVALIGMDSHEEGGGYKVGSEKFYTGPYRPDHIAEVGDVIFAGTEQGFGLLGSPLIVPESEKFTTYLFSGDVLKALPLKPEEFSVEYLYNLYRIEKFRVKTAYGDTGTTVRRIDNENFAEQVVPLPDLPTQQAINDIIAMIDQQIANNKALSKSLENLAQTIFKSWFVDFDPVKAKMVGEQPVGMDAETAALFPDSLVESELGPIPAGWEVYPLSDQIELLSGGTPRTSRGDYWQGEIPWFSVVDVPSNGGCFFVKTVKTITPTGLENSAAKLVRPGVSIISARGTVGKVVITAMPSTFNQSCYGIEGKYGDYYTYLLVKNQIFRLQSLSHGGMFDTITRETFRAIKTSLATAALLDKFECISKPIFEQIRNLQFENETLTKIRDALLPRLVSGELSIPEEMLAS